MLLYISSHSHWDREGGIYLLKTWIQLVELFIVIFDLWKWSDGQKFHMAKPCLSDYLRPCSVISTRASSRWSLHILHGMTTWSQRSQCHNTLIGQAELNRANLLRLVIPGYPLNMGQTPQILQKIRHSRSSFWAWCQTNRRQPSPRRWAIYLSNLLKCTGKGADGSVCWIILFITGTVTGTKIPVDKMNLWLSQSKIGECSRLCLNQPIVDDRQLRLADSTKLWWSIRVANNCSLTWLYPAPLMNMCKQWKVRFWIEIIYGYWRIDQSEENRWLVHWRYVFLSVISSKPSKQQLMFVEVVEPLTIITGGHNHGINDLCLENTLTEMRHTIVFSGYGVDDVHREKWSSFCQGQSSQTVRTNLLNRWKGISNSKSQSGHQYWLA